MGCGHQSGQQNIPFSSATEKSTEGEYPRSRSRIDYGQHLELYFVCINSPSPQQGRWPIDKDSFYKIEPKLGCATHASAMRARPAAFRMASLCCSWRSAKAFASLSSAEASGVRPRSVFFAPKGGQEARDLKAMDILVCSRHALISVRD